MDAVLAFAHSATAAGRDFLRRVPRQAWVGSAAVAALFGLGLTIRAFRTRAPEPKKQPPPPPDLNAYLRECGYQLPGSITDVESVEKINAEIFDDEQVVRGTFRNQPFIAAKLVKKDGSGEGFAYYIQGQETAQLCISGSDPTALSKAIFSRIVRGEDREYGFIAYGAIAAFLEGTPYNLANLPEIHTDRVGINMLGDRLMAFGTCGRKQFLGARCSMRGSEILIVFFSGEMEKVQGYSAQTPFQLTKSQFQAILKGESTQPYSLAQIASP